MQSRMLNAYSVAMNSRSQRHVLSVRKILRIIFAIYAPFTMIKESKKAFSTARSAGFAE